MTEFCPTQVVQFAFGILPAAVRILSDALQEAFLGKLGGTA